jgi:hypothetical protein
MMTSNAKNKIDTKNMLVIYFVIATQNSQNHNDEKHKSQQVQHKKTRVTIDVPIYLYF